MVLEGGLHLACGFIDVDVHGQVVALAQGGASRKGGVAHRIGRVRPDGHAHERVAAVTLDERLALADVLVVVRGPGGREADDDACGRAAQPRLAKAFSGGFGEEVEVRTAGDARADHFDARDQAAVVHEFRTHEASLGGPDLLGEPVHEGKVGAPAAKQVHGRVRVKVDEAGHDDACGQAHRLRLETRVADSGGLGRKNVCDAAAREDDGVILQNGVSGNDGNDPAGLDERVGGHAQPHDF